MASIHKLSVRGIRAFSPDDQEQVITFCFPLTIIVGANGCGKTTIIEALKYAVTGGLPPGNKSGQAFVHDPKSVGTTQVKAAVKLRFHNRAGKSMVVIRSMELTQKKTNMTFKQLDGILRTTDEKGNKVSLSHKCSELDRQIPQLLGVSKAILEHVVFCHQEDSSWPLMEGAVLKRRFDDIFDSTRYVKALEAIKDSRKQIMSEVKELKIVLGELNGHKHASTGFRQELDECRQVMSEVHDEMKEFDAKIHVTREECRKWNKVLQESNIIEEKITDKLTDVSIAEARISTHREGLSKDLCTTHSIDDLNNMIRGFERQTHGDKRALDETKARMQKFETNIGQAKEKKMTLSGCKGELMGDKKRYDDNLSKRVEQMEELATKYGLELTFSQSQQTDVTGMMGTQQDRLTSSIGSGSGSGSDMGNDMMSSSQGTCSNIHLTAEDLRAFDRSVENKRSDFEKDLDEYRSECRKAEDTIQTELSDLKAKITTMDNELIRLHDERSKATKEISKLPRTGSRVRKSEIDEAKRSAERFAKARNDLNKDPRRETIPKEIVEKESKIFKIKSDIDGLNSILKELRKCAEDQNNIDILQRQVTQDMELIEEMRQENSFLLRKFNIKIPNVETDNCLEVNNKMDSILDDVTNDMDKINNDYNQACERQKKSSSQFSKVSALLSHKQETLKRQKERLTELSKEDRGVHQIRNVIKAVRSFENQMYGDTRVAPNADPQQLLQYFTTRIGELSTEELQPESVSKVIKKLKKLVKKKNRDGVVVELICPCCTRALDVAEAVVFQEEMKALADPSNSAIIKSDQSAAKANRSAMTNYENWRNLISRHINDWMDHQRISDEIEGLKVEIARDENKVSTSQSAHDEDQEKVRELKEDQGELQQMQDLARRLRDEIGKITNKRSQISSREEELKLIAPRASGKDLSTTEREMNTKMEEKESLTNQISALNKETSTLNSSINQANISATRAENLVREKEKAYQNEQEAQTKKQMLKDSIDLVKEQEEKLKSQIVPVRQKANMKESEKSRVRSTTQTEMDKKSHLCTKFNNDAEKIDMITKQIDEFKSSDSLERLETIDTDINNNTKEIIEIESDLNELRPKLKSLQERVDDQGAHRKNVERNIELLGLISNKQKLDDETELLQCQFEDLKTDSAQEKFNEAQNKIKSYESEKHRREGSKEALQCQQRELKRKLNTSEYKNIDERHRVKMIETETAYLAVEDLELYHSALDKALLRYHGIKIQEINKIIKELWALTYRGEDITNIRLTSDQETNSRSTRSYNYRVVMTKGTTELDMRGRCSAGQRVLASIVIRLALAETFCLNCGVMALDEPTTNLDFANKRGLAIALAQIIATRAAQDNFQLVIITHDEEFVSMMKNELTTHTGFNMPEKYYMVSREEGNDGCYYSKIDSVDWGEL